MALGTPRLFRRRHRADLLPAGRPLSRSPHPRHRPVGRRGAGGAGGAPRHPPARRRRDPGAAGRAFGWRHRPGAARRPDAGRWRDPGRQLRARPVTADGRDPAGLCRAGHGRQRRRSEPHRAIAGPRQRHWQRQCAAPAGRSGGRGGIRPRALYLAGRQGRPALRAGRAHPFGAGLYRLVCLVGRPADRAQHRGRRADHHLPLRAGPRGAGGDHRRLGPAVQTRHADQT